MAEVRTYAKSSTFQMESLKQDLVHFLDVTQHLEVQVFEMENRIIIQAMEDDSKWKKFLGMDVSITIEFKEEKDLLSVTVGNAKWMDKASVASLGAIFFTPLLITAGIGAVKQGALPVQIFDRVEGYLTGRNFSTTQ